MPKEVLISVDIEADGPIPGDYSMVSLGACLVEDSAVGFYCELKPISGNFIKAAVEITGLNRDDLIANGIAPTRAMQQFADWLQQMCGPNQRPVFVAFNATFDWMFVHWYFIHFLGHDPFGISGWDIKAYYAGIMGKHAWEETSKNRMERAWRSDRPHTHNALDDAQEQARIFLKLRRHTGII